MRKTVIIALAIIVIVVIIGGVFGYNYLTANNNQNNTPANTLSVDAIRDQSMTYILANHTQIFDLMPTGDWSGGRETSLVGSETYLYTNGNWTVEITYPVISNPLYTVNATCTSNGRATWIGTYQDGIIIETQCSIPAATDLTQPQVRDLTMQYIKAYHNQTAPYMQNLVWSGGSVTNGTIVGSETYAYIAGGSAGWIVTLQYPVVPNPLYNVNATYSAPASPASPPIDWEGFMQGGVICEGKFTYHP